MNDIVRNWIQMLTGIPIPNLHGKETKALNIGSCSWDDTMIW